MNKSIVLKSFNFSKPLLGSHILTLSAIENVEGHVSFKLTLVFGSDIISEDLFWSLDYAIERFSEYRTRLLG